MSEEKSFPEALPEEPEAASASVAIDVGEQLRLAREARGVSINEVSATLKLSPRQVKAIEANEWFQWPRTVIRGFIRNYARYLELDIAPLMSTLDEAPMPESPELVVGPSSRVDMPREGGSDRRDYLRVLAGLLILVFAILACFLVPVETWRSALASFVDSQEKQTDSAKTPGSRSEAGVILAVPEAVIVPASPAPVLPEPPAPAPPPVPTPEPPVHGQSVSSPANLSFSFAQDSWVEVRDRSGQTLLSQNNPGGSRREISGQPPFSLVVGNVRGTTLLYKGKNVPLLQHSVGGVARLTLE
jgi:cytoskeleton protein RodZ